MHELIFMHAEMAMAMAMAMDDGRWTVMIFIHNNRPLFIHSFIRILSTVTRMMSLISTRYLLVHTSNNMMLIIDTVCTVFQTLLYF